jgi:camelysin-like metallo-endopeptidase
MSLLLFLRSFSRTQQWKLLLVAAMATGVLATMAGRGTLAYFTTQVSSTQNAFTEGYLHYSITQYDATTAGGTQAGGSGSLTTSMTLDNMKPGDVVYAPLIVQNTGSLDSRWGINYTTAKVNGGDSDDLAKALKIAIVGNGAHIAAGSTATKADCTSTGMTSTKFPEQILPLASMYPAPTPLMDSNNTAHAHDGTFAGGDAATKSLQLAHGDTDILCVEITFPDGGVSVPDGSHAAVDDNAWNGDASTTYSTTLTFTIGGQQLANAAEFDETSALPGAHY